MTRITFYAFCSIKGGVGKSTLAVATAKLLAARGRVPVLIDADLTGTSLVDGLALCAPKVALRQDGAMDLDAAFTGEHLPRAETVRLRNRRRAATMISPPPPPFLNDALMYEAQGSDRDCHVDAMLWAHERPDKVLYLPSSPLRQDVETSVGWLHGDEPFQWVRRVAWVLDALFLQRTDVTDVIIDLPPGVVGFTHESLVFLAALASDKPLPDGYPTWKQGGERSIVRVFLVATPDWNDFVPALEYVATSSVHLPALTLLPMINKANAKSPSELQDEAQATIDPVLRPLGIEKRLLYIDEHRATLGQIFRRRDLVLTDDLNRIAELLLVEGAR